jgi:hypothetical protein
MKGLGLKLTATTLIIACFAGCGGSGGDASVSTAQPEGAISSRSADFEKYSGKGASELHIAEFGTEAGSEDRLNAQGTINAYLRTTNAGKWSSACDLVSDTLRGQIAEIARQSKEVPVPGCGEILETLAVISGGRRGKAPLLAPEGIASLRIKKGPGGGFALFHGSDGADYWMTVKREDGDWKVFSAAPQPFG